MLAKYLDCDASDLALVQNATSGLNSVISSLELSSKHKVMCLDLAYGSVKLMLKRRCQLEKCEFVAYPVARTIFSKKPISAQVPI